MHTAVPSLNLTLLALLRFFHCRCLGLLILQHCLFAERALLAPGHGSGAPQRVWQGWATLFVAYVSSEFVAHCVATRIERIRKD